MQTPDILLIEDNESDAELTMRSLKKAGLLNSIEWIDDSEKALDFLLKSENSIHIKMILLDLKLPKISGVEMLDIIKKNSSLKHIPIIIMTSSSIDKDIEECYRRGANSYIVKPIDFNNFSEVVKTVGYYWLMVNKSI